MADRAQFQKKLGELLAVAASQNNKMTSQEVQAFFQDDNLTDEQMNLVHEFLMSQKVEVIGYTGTIENTEKTEQEEKDTLSQQEKDYVAEYLIDIEISDILDFEKGLFEYIDTKYPEVPESIRTTGEIKEDIEKKLIEAIEGFKAEFTKNK